MILNKALTCSLSDGWHWDYHTFFDWFWNKLRFCLPKLQFSDRLDLLDCRDCSSIWLQIEFACSWYSRGDFHVVDWCYQLQEVPNQRLETLLNQKFDVFPSKSVQLVIHINVFMTPISRHKKKWIRTTLLLGTVLLKIRIHATERVHYFP